MIQIIDRVDDGDDMVGDTDLESEEDEKEQERAGAADVVHVLQDATSPLRNVQDVLGLDGQSRARMKSEGITQVGHIHGIEDLLREGLVDGLTSVEKVKLLQYLSWRSNFQERAKGALPNPQRDFTIDEYNRYKRATLRTSYVWPFLGIWNMPDGQEAKGRNSKDDDDVEQNAHGDTPLVVEQQLQQNARLQEHFAQAEEFHMDFHEGMGQKEDLKNAIESEYHQLIAK
mmetsp:Transcript_31632/g.52199  ORF Transcript_31632/g.52199 Transcript_31632/m.52199 type:complete len:229 (-) Transcript_31632:45-731(-)